MTDLMAREQQMRNRMLAVRAYYPEYSESVSRLARYISNMVSEFNTILTYPEWRKNADPILTLLWHATNNARGEWSKVQGQEQAHIMWNKLFYAGLGRLGWKHWAKVLNQIPADAPNYYGADGSFVGMLRAKLNQWLAGDTPEWPTLGAPSLGFWEAVDEGNESEVPIPVEREDLPQTTTTQEEPTMNLPEQVEQFLGRNRHMARWTSIPTNMSELQALLTKQPTSRQEENFLCALRAVAQTAVTQETVQVVAPVVEEPVQVVEEPVQVVPQTTEAPVVAEPEQPEETVVVPARATQHKPVNFARDNWYEFRFTYYLPEGQQYVTRWNDWAYRQFPNTVPIEEASAYADKHLTELWEERAGDRPRGFNNQEWLTELETLINEYYSPYEAWLQEHPQPTVEPAVEHTVEPTVEPAVEPVEPVVPTVEPAVEPVEPVVPTVEPAVPVVEPAVTVVESTKPESTAPVQLYELVQPNQGPDYLQKQLGLPHCVGGRVMGQQVQLFFDAPTENARPRKVSPKWFSGLGITVPTPVESPVAAMPEQPTPVETPEMAMPEQPTPVETNAQETEKPAALLKVIDPKAQPARKLKAARAKGEYDIHVADIDRTVQALTGLTIPVNCAVELEEAAVYYLCLSERGVSKFRQCAAYYGIK